MVGRHSAASPCFQRIPSGGLWIIRVCARLLLNIVFLTGAAACKERPLPNSALPQKAYVWQRAWTGEVRQSLETAADLLDGVVVLGAHLRQTASGVPESVPSNVDWSALARFGKPVGVAVRVEGAMLPDAIFAGGVLKGLLQDAAASGLKISEVQIDYGSPERGLSKYAAWLRVLKKQLHPNMVTITAIPAWLNHPNCARVFKEAPRFVLQVHSVPTREPKEQVAIFETARAWRWIHAADRYGVPFRVSLPTYGALLGYTPQGDSLGMALDGVQPAWPAGTRVAEFRSDAQELSAFSAQIARDRPRHLEGLFWYRLPVGRTQRNWKWPTFRAVLEGRSPRHELKVEVVGAELMDLKIVNHGEAEERLDCGVRVTWSGGAPVAMEALKGWEIREENAGVLFRRNGAPVNILSPGGIRGIGWIRFNAPLSTHAEIVP